VATGGVRCDRRGVRHVLAELGDLDDHLGVSLDVPNDPPLTYSGGDGTDAVDYGAGPVAVTLDGDDDDGRRGRDDIRPDVEQVLGTVTADTLTGSAAANSLSGDAGADTLSGLAGDDFVDALDFVDCESEGDCERPEIDTISCGEGFDTVDVDSTDAVATDCELIARANVIGGTDAADTIAAWRPALQIFSSAGDDRITGPGLNTLNAGSGNDYVRVFGNSGSSLTGGSGNDRVISGRGGDFISGGYGNDRLYGYNGKDEIQGGAGRDVFYGGERNDRITSRERGDERDVVNCGSGRDVVIADRRDRVARNCERVIRG
jgi:Ca2+-binding RTX toxin-like protein